VISARVFRAGEELTDVPVDDLSRLRSQPDTLVWVDVTGGTDEEIDQMGEEFAIHPLALEDCRHQHQRPKVDQYQRHLLLVAYGTEAAIQGKPTRLHELDLVAGENFMVTFHQVPPIDAETIAKRIQAHPELTHHGAGFLLYVVLDELVDSFVPTMDSVGERVEDLGEAVFAGRQVENDVFALRRDLVTIRRVVEPMADAMTVLLRRELGLFEEETRHYLQDIYDHLLRISQSVEAYQDLAAGALEANLTMASTALALRLPLRTRLDARAGGRPVGLLQAQALAVGSRAQLPLATPEILLHRCGPVGMPIHRAWKSTPTMSSTTRMAAATQSTTRQNGDHHKGGGDPRLDGDDPRPSISHREADVDRRDQDQRERIEGGWSNPPEAELRLGLCPLR
jgi:magnesium transporter